MKKIRILLVCFVLVFSGLGFISCYSYAKEYRIDGEWTGESAWLITTEYTDGGREAGTFSFSIPHAANAYTGRLVKVGVNKYRSKKKGLIFRFYSNRVIVKVKNKRRYESWMAGTYKLDSRGFYA